MSSSESLGYAIIGCGWVAGDHARGVQALADEDVRLVAVADRDPSKAAAIAEAYDVRHMYEDYRDLLEREDVHAVSICLPDFLHAEAAIAAARSGKHILCEKPLALDVTSADAMLTAATESGVNLGVVFNHRYAPDNIRARAAIRDGALGRVLVGDVMHSSSLSGDPDNSSPWRGLQGRSTGGVLSTQAIHFLDLLLWFAGRATSVQAFTDSLAGGSRDHEDTAAVVLRLESGALATLISTNGSPIEDDFTGTRVEIQGTEGYLALSGDQLTSVRLRPGYHLADVTLPSLIGDDSDVVFGGGHIHEVMDFVRAIRRSADAPIPGEDGRHLMAVLAAAYRSARDGGEVQVEEPTGAYPRREDDEQSLLWAVGRDVEQPART